MPSQTVRISRDAHRILRDLATRLHTPMQAVLDRAIEEFRRKTFIASANEAYAALRKDPEAWKEECSERALWERALGDGLEPGKRS